MIYIYENETTSPDLEQIKIDVLASDMTDKILEYSTWEKDSEELKIIFTNTLDAGDKIILDEIVDSNELKRLKKAKMAAIDVKTEKIITITGFDFGGEHFDLEIIDQINYMGVHGGRDNLTYPFELPNASYTARHALQNSAEVHSFYMTAVGTVKAIREGGWTLKESIVACTTVAEVEAIEDNR